MSVDCERSGTKSATGSWSEANGSESIIHSLSIRVEYHRSFEYCLTRRRPMYPRRSSRTPKPSWKSSLRSPSPKEEVIRRKFRGKRQRTGQRKADAGDGTVNAGEGGNRDILDAIADAHGAKLAAEEEDGACVEVVDKGVDESDEDCGSSIASGPSLLHHATPKKWRPSEDLCSACRKLRQRAKKMKAPIKNKLLDNDPKSLTCDQWVLIKTWTPRRLPNATGKLLTHLQLVQKRLEKGGEPSGQNVGEGEPSACPRPHVLLQRNLRRCVRVPVKRGRKGNKRRRRTGGDSQGPRVAKQKRLHSNSNRRHVSSSHIADSGLSPPGGDDGSPGSEGRSDREISGQADTTAEAVPSTVALETAKPREPPPRQKTPKRMRGFRDLLAQLRGNNSMIVRETR